MRVFLCIFLSTILSTNLLANYTTPGTGATYTLNDLVANAGGDVVSVNGEYLVNDTIIIAVNDVLSIFTDETVKFAENVLLDIKGNVIITPPNGVLFTAQDPALGFRGMRLDFSTNSMLQKLTYEYASALRISDCSPSLSECVIRYNGESTSLGSGAITLFRSKAVITDCRFIENRRAAVVGGGNIANAPIIIGSYFYRNVMANINVAQINLGGTGSDTAKIVNCQIIGGNSLSGAIGVFPFGISANILIKQNLIKGNRYGINLIGGSSINSVVSYNRIEDNNIDNNPLLSGSGIAFTANGTSPQNSIVTGNVFERNLWGITVYSQASGVPVPGPKPNLGDLTNADTTDDGKNRFINNTNSNTPGVDFYNNSSDPIFAMGNYWNTNVEAEVESRIFHQPDNAQLGLVTYSSFVLPVQLLQFTAQPLGSDAVLQWRTAQETSSRFFVVEKSNDAVTFFEVTRVDAAGNSSTARTYSSTDVRAGAFGGTFYYRLRIVDIDGTQRYSPVEKISFSSTVSGPIRRIYPTVVRGTEFFFAEIVSDENQVIQIHFADASGKLLGSGKHLLTKGNNKLSLQLPTASTGWITLKLTGSGLSQSMRLLHLQQ